MSDSLTLSSPISVTNPDIPYDRFTIYLSESPIFQQRADGKIIGIEGAMSLRVIPYRVLPDGVHEFRDDLAYTESWGDVYARSASDPALAEALAGQMEVIRRFLAARGL